MCVSLKKVSQLGYMPKRDDYEKVTITHDFIISRLLILI